MNDFFSYIKSNPSWAIGALFAIGGVLLTLYSSYSSGKQADNIEKLGQKNFELGEKIKDLNDATKNIVEKIEIITTASSQQSAENIILSKKSNELINEVNELTKETKLLIRSINHRTKEQADENLKTGEFKFAPIPLNSSFAIVFGNNTFRKSIEDYKTSSKIIDYDDILIKMKVDENNRALFSTKVYGRNGELVAEVIENKWRPNFNFTGKFNYNDTSFEVIDNYGNVALNVDVSDPHAIVVNGLFYGKTGSLMIVGKGGMKIANSSLSPARLERELKTLELTPIFEYTGAGWLHKRKK